jgi:hypothetical protein
MSCEAFERRLDEEGPESASAAFPGHVAQCARCRAAWIAARGVEAVLSAVPPPAPPGFTDRVLARMAQADEMRARAKGISAGALPWWVRAAAQPATLLAALLGALVAWRPDALLSFGVAAAEAMTARWAQGLGVEVLLRSLLGPEVAAPFADPAFRLGLALGLVPLVMMGSRVLFQWLERRVAGALSSRLPRLG